MNSIYKNVSGQKIAVFAWDKINGQPKTGDAANITAQISKDGGASAAMNDTNPTELDATNHKGVYLFDPTQAESNADLSVVTPSTTTSGITFDPPVLFIYTRPRPGIPRGVAFPDFEFVMLDSTDHVTPKIGLTGFTAEISKDGGAFSPITPGTVSEVGNGVYKISLSTTEKDALVITLKFTAAGADQRTITIITSS